MTERLIDELAANQAAERWGNPHSNTPDGDRATASLVIQQEVDRWLSKATDEEIAALTELAGRSSAAFLTAAIADLFDTLLTDPQIDN